MPGHTHFDEATEEYLEAIYRLDVEGSGVTTSGLAADRGVAAGSASGMLRKLTESGFLVHKAHGSVKLTPRGLQIAARVIRRHRLAECLLTSVLGLPWVVVDEEACRLEHAISARVEERLVTLLGDPRYCPHGLPIPTADLTIPHRVEEKLITARSGQCVRIIDVGEGIPSLLRFLDEIGVRPGMTVRIVERAPLNGPITVAGAKGRHAISAELAQHITVQVVEEELRTA